MDLIEKSIELLSLQTPFVAVRFFGNFINKTVMLVTKDDFFCDYEFDSENEDVLKKEALSVLDSKSKNGNIDIQGKKVEIYFELCSPNKTLLIVGAGHIALPLCSIAKLIGFKVIVIDDREQFAHKTRFPQADEIIVDSFANALRTFPFHKYSYIVLVTRGHVYDKECLEIVLEKETAYIGMIGSYRRVKSVFKLLEETYSQEQLAKVHAPIGLPLGGGTAEEIAVSIISEIISVYSVGPEWALSLKDLFRRKK